MIIAPRQSGFTLIELVVVLTIIAILAAVALPRIIALQRDTRIAKLSAARGAVASAAALAHAALLTRNSMADTTACALGGNADNLPGSTATPGSLCIEGGLISTVYGYPACTPIPAGPGAKPGIVAAAGFSTVFDATPAILQSEGYSATVSGGVTTFQILGAADPVNCMFSYTQASSASAPAQISLASTSGC